MTMQPGDAFFSGQLDGRKLGQALFLLGPSLPTESPLPLPRGLARAIFPQGFVPQFPAAIPALPAGLPANQVIPPVAANQVIPPAPVVPVPPPAAPFGYRPASSGGEPIEPARSQRIRIRERAGL